MSETIRIYLAGDSTVQSYKKESAPQAGWGQFIANHFTDNVSFINRAIGGRSSKSFVKEGRLDAIFEDIQAGDYLFIQMGHNDSTKSKPERYTEPYSEYKEYLMKYVQGARERDAIPVLITPVGRLHMEDGVFLNDFKDYCAAMKQAAVQEDAVLIDLMEKSLQHYGELGYDKTRELFMVSINGTDHTHFTEQGARHIAALVAQGVEACGLPISQFVIPKK